jgi:hypothetical protein
MEDKAWWKRQVDLNWKRARIWMDSFLMITPSRQFEIQELLLCNLDPRSFQPAAQKHFCAAQIWIQNLRNYRYFDHFPLLFDRK